MTAKNPNTPCHYWCLRQVKKKGENLEEHVIQNLERQNMFLQLSK
jgi:hypothetical protein